MQPLVLAFMAAMLTQVLPNTVTADKVITIKTTIEHKFAINHALVLTYSDTAERDEILQQLFALWKTVLADSQVSSLSYKFLKESDALMPNQHVVQYIVSGSSKAQIILKDITDSFESALPTSGISEAATLASLQSGGSSSQMVSGGKGLISFNAEIQTFLTYQTASERDAILQQILSLWKTTFASSQFTGLSISFISEESSVTSGDKKVTYRISVKSNDAVDMKMITQQFLSALQSAHLAGVRVTSSSS
jgi:hypothetical protein